MDQNKNLENLENNQLENQEKNEVEHVQPSTIEENLVSTEKKKTAADLVLEKLQKIKDSSNDVKKVEKLKEIEKEVKIIAQPDTIEVEEEEDDDDEEFAGKTQAVEMPNYNDFSREQLVELFVELLAEPFDKISDRAEVIKNTFYKKRNLEINERKQKFVDQGGDATDFKADFDEIDNQFKAEYDKFRALKQQKNEQVEADHQRNLNLKNEIIDKIEGLINKDETLNRTFEEFHSLRDEWNNLGSVPQAEAKPLLEKYNFTLQKFYDWVKINKELRDLDLKRNLEHKIKLCEEAESLLIEPKIVKAYKKLQNLHDRWKEIGPVPNEHREEVWNRFKEMSSLVNKKHYEYFQEIKQQQSDNLKAKELLCEEAEKIAEADYKKSKEWQIKTDEINELMKLWKLIGFAPKKNNNDIFERFITARKQFFDRKQEYYQSYTDILEKNLQLKEELIVDAENAKDSTNWKQTTDLFVKLQKRWKNIGAVPNAKREEIWARFNAVCNYFFEKKRDHFKNRKDEEETNLKLKQEIIEKIKSIELEKTPEENLKSLQELQKQWSDIGYVPFKQKDSVYKEYKAALEEKFKTLNINFEHRRDLENKNRIDNLLTSDKADYKLRVEIDNVKNDIATLNSEIITLENNLSFFVRSKNSEAILDNFNKKIQKLKIKKQEQENMLVTLSKAYKEAQKIKN
ncbi:MAG: DUF349 domain-containing protein [Bacteroidales bacterium]|nr:DUF349 domain-containing protein [Bacteroidales bacterium]